jgi:hypothetical protein
MGLNRIDSAQERSRMPNQKYYKKKESQRWERKETHLLLFIFIAHSAAHF